MNYQAIAISIENKSYTVGCYGIAFNEHAKNTLFAALSQNETRLKNAFRVASRALQYAAGRYCAKQCLIVSGYPQKDLANIDIGTASWGFPFLNQEPAGYNLSISHTSTIAAAAIAQTEIPLGIDVEVCNTSNNDVIFSQLSDSEKRLVYQYSLNDYTKLLHVMWSAKEAVSKALKTGFKLPMHNFDITAINEKESNAFFISFGSLNMLSAIAVYTNNTVFALALPANTVINEHFKLKISNFINSFTNDKKDIR